MAVTVRVLILKKNSLQSRIYGSNYALIIGDDSMSPEFLKSDIVLIKSNFKKVSSSCYSVRMDEKDSIGKDIRKCIFHDTIVVMIPLNDTYETIIVDCSKIEYDPVAGKVNSRYRECRHIK